MDVIKFLNPLIQKSFRFLFATILKTFIGHGFLEDCVSFPKIDNLTFTIILILSKF